jgi:hypothetical protein
VPIASLGSRARITSSQRTPVGRLALSGLRLGITRRAAVDAAPMIGADGAAPRTMGSSRREDTIVET